MCVVLFLCVFFQSNSLNAAKLMRKKIAEVMKVYWKPRFSAIRGPIKQPMALPVPTKAVNKPALPRGITSIESESTEME